MMLWLIALSCLGEPYEVMLSGRVRASQHEDAPASDIHVSSLEPELDLHSETQTNEDGEFQVAVIANGVFHVFFSKEGVATTSFSGIAGSSDFSFDSEHFFVRSTAEVEALRALHSSCPESEQEGGVIEGIVQFPLISDKTDDYLIAERARVLASHNDAVSYTACYLDAEGESLEAGEEVGATGRFAIFGVQEGVVNLEFQQDIENKTLSNYAFIYMPENGIAPIFPAFIDLP